MIQIYQGDILYRKIDKLPKLSDNLGNLGNLSNLDNLDNFKGKKIKNFVVAEGEITGHKHEILVDEKSDVEIMEVSNGKFILNIIKGTATITHPDHKPEQILQTGFYFIVRQREYDPILEERMVND